MKKEIIMSVYDYSFTDNNGNIVELSKFKENTLLLVNVASNCGFTVQYEGLQALSKKHENRGLVVIGFPCNQFNEQEPGTDEDIKDFCQTRYGVDFLISTKINVNGEDAHPLFKYLVSKAEFDEVPWNFTKFIVNDAEFTAISPHVTPEEMENVIELALQKN
jgi:glutathione peroxidase